MRWWNIVITSMIYPKDACYLHVEHHKVSELICVVIEFHDFTKINHISPVKFYGYMVYALCTSFVRAGYGWDALLNTHCQQLEKMPL